MTESAQVSSDLGPLHPVTRLGRVLQQIKSFAALHTVELEQFASQLEASGQPEAADRLRKLCEIQTQEIRYILDELADLRADLERAATAASAGESVDSPSPDAASRSTDPAASSPKRARWLAEQSARANQLVSRRQLLSRRKPEARSP